MRTFTLAIVFLVGCSNPDQAGSGDGAMHLPGLMSIDVSPASASLTITNATAATQPFTALGHFSDGHSEDVTARVGWSLTDPGIGTFDAMGGFTSATTRGGHATVTASDGQVAGTADLLVKLVTSRVSSDDGSTAPADSASHFAGATEDPTLAPALAYPLDGALVPHNLGLLEVQWKKPGTAPDLFEVSFESDTIDLKIYTNAAPPGGGRLSLKPEEWFALADTVSGSKVQVQVRGAVTATPGKAGTSTAAMLQIGSDDVVGGIYYFAPVSGTGAQIGQIMRHAFGDTAGTPQSFYAPNNATRCVGCHVLTHDGAKFAITYDGGDGKAAELDVASLNILVNEDANRRWNFASFSPDGTQMAATSDGSLRIIDTSGGAANGTVLQPLETGSSTHAASHPDWSPDGKSLVYVVTPAPAVNPTPLIIEEWNFTQGSIVIAHADAAGMFGPPTTLVPGGPGLNNYYPSFSPDGKWILFDRSTNGSYNDPTAQLMVISADGMVGPIALTASNGAVANVTNSWPRWAPFIVHNGEGGDLYYFTYSSTRDYGIELVGVAAPQIWMATFNPQGTAADPSSVPFWMPYQDVKSHNHIAQWTTQIVGIN
jgi:hypothetical protein